MLLSVSALVGTGSWYRAAAEAKNETTPRQESAIRVFLDTRSNEDYIKTEIPFVNYVRDRAQAEVHVLVTSLPSGGDRTEHSILFTGQERFVGVNDTLSCVTKALDTQEYVRSEIVRIMKLGLIRYVSRTPQGEVIRISYPRETAPEEIVDKWNYWVFGVGADASFSGEESSESVDYSGALSADRVTEAWKIAFKVGTDYREARYDVGTEEVVSISRQSVIKGMVVKSLGEHWSVGGYADASKSLYYNLDVSVYAAPAVEFDVFPYSQATRRDLRFMYTIGYQFNRYEEETIYFVTEEDVLVQELSLDIDVKENWGTIGGNVTGSNYMHLGGCRKESPSSELQATRPSTIRFRFRAGARRKKTFFSNADSWRPSISTECLRASRGSSDPSTQTLSTPGFKCARADPPGSSCAGSCGLI
jgi:hypothetical protein